MQSSERTEDRVGSGVLEASNGSGCRVAAHLSSSSVEIATQRDRNSNNSRQISHLNRSAAQNLNSTGRMIAGSTAAIGSVAPEQRRLCGGVFMPYLADMMQLEQSG